LRASRRMAATHGLAAILRDAAKTPLLRMRSEIYSQAPQDEAEGARKTYPCFDEPRVFQLLQGTLESV